MGGGDLGMGRGKRAYGTYGEEGTRKGKIIWNVNKEYGKEKKKKKYLSLKFSNHGQLENKSTCEVKSIAPFPVQFDVCFQCFL